MRLTIWLIAAELALLAAGKRPTAAEADALIQQQVVNLIPSLCQGLVP